MDSSTKRDSLTVEGVAKTDGIPRVIITKEGEGGKSDQPKLIRKTSIRRRVSKDDSQKTPEVKYGNLPDVYENIRDRMMADKGVQNTIESLEERWRMIMFMYEDCVTMIEAKLERDRERRLIKHKQEIIALSLIYGSLIIPISIMIFIVYLFVIFF